jgi:hypothetical protein
MEWDQHAAPHTTRARTLHLSNDACGGYVRELVWQGAVERLHLFA